MNAQNEGPAEPPGAGLAAGRRWLGVEFRHLSALAAVARESSFRRAAESLGYVQSAISGQIAQLERAVGSQLVERSSGSAGATLTPAGRVLLSHIDEILGRFEAARVDLRSLAEGRGSTIRVGVLQGVAERRLPPILAAFHQRFREAEVIIDESRDDEDNFDRLAHGEIDLLITELPLPSGPFEHTLLERDAYVLLVAADSDLAAQAGPPTAGQLARLPLILPAPPRQQDRLISRLHENLIDQSPWLRPRSVASVQALVGAGLGVAIVPGLAVDRDDASTVAIQSPGLLPDRLLVLVHHREREYAECVQVFAQLVREMFNPRSCLP